MFLDEIDFIVRGGRGGDGCSSFRREKYVSRGGPDGGDGGDGGSVVLIATTHENTLYHLAGRRSFEAGKGQPGRGAGCTGRKGEDLVLRVPVGTIVLDADHGNALKDLSRIDDPFVVARGGRGGRGNTRFATATNRTPRQAETGGDAEDRHIRLSLKLIADVGLVGLPNAGKSTLLATLSRARPRVADYPFTTLEPHLGIVEVRDRFTFVMADIPGLIEGAHLGKGLGDKFLKHVERTHVLLHLVDCSEDTDPLESCRVIQQELAGYSQSLGQRPRLLIATKVEDEVSRERARALAEGLESDVLQISAVTGDGVTEMLDALVGLLRGD